MTPSEVEYLTGIVRLEAAKSLPRNYLVMTQENIVSLLPPDKTLEDCQSECEVDMGRLLGARYIITGEVLRFGSSLRLTLRLHDTKTGRLIASEIAKGKEIEDLEDPTSASIHSLLQSLVPQTTEDLRGRAERAHNEHKDPPPQQSARDRRRAAIAARVRVEAEAKAQAQARARAKAEAHAKARAEAKAKAKEAAEVKERAKRRRSKQITPTTSDVYEHPQVEFQAGYSRSQCAPNGDLGCGDLSQSGGASKFNDFGVQYKLLQLSQLSFASDLRFTTNEIGDEGSRGRHNVSTLSVGLATTYVAQPWFTRLQLGWGIQSGEVIIRDASSEISFVYSDAAIRFGAEAGMLIGSFSMSLYLQNESVPQKTTLCTGTDCEQMWTLGAQQLGFRIGLLL